MSFSRKTILIAGAALLAACGDKVTVQEYTPPTTTTVAKINGVEVSPASATLNVGQTITMTAAVNADAGLATTVTWSSSDVTKASVSAAGVVTAVAATPGVAICAASTVDTGKKGCASVIVTAAPVLLPASIQIEKITVGNVNTPVNPNAVAGQIDVTLNVNPGNQVITKVELLVGGVVAGSQTFTAAQAAALRFAADEAVLAQTTFPQIVFSVNTAAYSTTTGIPTWLNGARAVSARLYTTAGGTTSAASASATQNLTFANVDGFHVTSTGGTSAVDATGYRWTGNGSLVVSALPVMFSGTAVGTVNAALAGVCGAVGGTGSTGSATTATAGVYAVTLALTGSQSPVGCATTTPNIPVITATSSAGDVLPLVANGTINTQTGFRWDNVAPAAVAGSTFFGVSPNIRINVNPNGRANGWINDAVVLNGSTITTATSNNFLCSAPAGAVGACTTLDTLPRDAGIAGTVTYSVQVGATKAAAYAAAPITSAAALAATATNAGYCAIAFASDLLGNKTSLTTAQQATACGAEANSTLIGVDRAAPTIAYTALALAANARLSGASIGGEWQVTVNDTGLVGNSGMLPTAPVKMTASRRAAGTTPNSAGTTTLKAADGATTVTALSATGVVAGAPLYTTSLTAITGAANHAYWTYNATAWDAAGNSASVAPRVIVYDATAPVPGAPTAPLTITALGYTASAFINEDLDIQDYAFNGTYTGAPVVAPATIGMPWVAVNGYNAATFSNTNFLVSTTVNLPMAIQANMAAGLTNIANLSTISRSQGNLAAVSGVTAFATVTPGAAITFPSMLTFPAIAGPAGVTGIVTGNTTAATAGTCVPLCGTAVLTAVATGTTAVFNNPFSRIDFYMLDASGARYMLIGSSASPTLTDNGAVRTFTWTFTATGSTIYSTLNGAGATWASQIVALGMNATGQVGMVTAALTPINVVF